MIDPEGIVSEYTYNSDNQIVLEARNVSPSSNDQPTLYTRYAYNGYGRLRYVVSHEGRVTENLYDADGQLVRTLVYSGHEDPDAGQSYRFGQGTDTILSSADVLAWTQTLTNLENLANTRYWYDHRGASVEEWRTYGGTSATGSSDNSQGITRNYFTTDQHGRLIESSVRHNVSEFSFDGLGRVTLSDNSVTGSITYTYNDDGTAGIPQAHMTVVTGAGHTTTTVYNNLGQVVSTS
ncbi:hypothetical protein, partial [Maricaulis sp. D1M11]|uniref:hypothetical protein n=1 Tax=Maricaulis sp. D1M11 TaxID=3076117 RepID=UPI0039B43D7A